MLSCKFSWFKTVSVVVILVYSTFSLYSAYVILFKDNHGSTVEKQPSSKNRQNDVKQIVHIWGKAAIGFYLWEHILEGFLHSSDSGLTYNGSITIENIEFRFLTGPGVVQGRVPYDVKYVVLVINGREKAKISFAENWLNYLNYLPKLEAAAVVMLGDEKCNNDWILQHTSLHDGKVKVIWMTYDSPLVDNKLVYQWPLGIATYRNFPHLHPSQVDTQTPRRHLCNFLGTVYPNSSRTRLLQTLNKVPNTCLLQFRENWEAEETDDSLINYVTTLLDSGLTLSPVGFNSECYRIYEAFSCGSIPVVEDVMTEGNCGGESRTPFRLLKLYNAPIIYVKSWERDLLPLLEQHKRLPDKVKAKLRLKTLIWYHNFLEQLKKHFVKTIQSRLLSVS